MKKKSRQLSFIGLWIFIGILLLYFGVTYLKGLSVFSNTKTYYVRFDDVSGLSIASPVMVNGYKVGTVQGMEFRLEQGASTIVELDVKRRHRLPIDTRAVIKQSLLGGAQVDLTVGSSNVFLEEGDTLGILPKDPDVMAILNETIIPTILRLLPKIDSTLSALNSIANDPNIKGTIAEANATMRNAKQTMQNLQEVSSQLKTYSRESIPELLGNIQQASKSLTTFGSQLDSVDLVALVDELEGSIRQLRTLGEQLNSGQGTMGKLVYDEQLYIRIDSVLRNADDLVNEVKKNPRKYLKISVF